MPVFIGRYADEEYHFLAAAPARDEAVALADSHLGEPLYDSVARLPGPWILTFQAGREAGGWRADFSGRLAGLHPETPAFAQALAQRHDRPKAQEASRAAQRLRIRDPRVLAAYYPRCSACRQRHPAGRSCVAHA